MLRTGIWGHGHACTSPAFLFIELVTRIHGLKFGAFMWNSTPSLHGNKILALSLEICWEVTAL